MASSRGLTSWKEICHWFAVIIPIWLQAEHPLSTPRLNLPLQKRLPLRFRQVRHNCHVINSIERCKPRGTAMWAVRPLGRTQRVQILLFILHCLNHTLLSNTLLDHKSLNGPGSRPSSALPCSLMALCSKLFFLFFPDRKFSCLQVWI